MMTTTITALSLALLLAQSIILSLVESLSLIPTYQRHECSHNNHNHDRRAFIANTLVTASCTLLQPTPALATDDITTDRNRNGKPFAPLTALLPATRLKLWVDEVHSLSTQLSTTTTPLQSDQQQLLLLQQINHKLSNPPKLFHEETPTKNRSNTTPLTAQLTTSISSANKDQYKQNRSGLNPTSTLMAMFNQADVERQFGILQYSEFKREQDNELRAAFNYYTKRLVYLDEYLLTAPKEQRKEMIRNDNLPLVTDVIGSDLDRRDLVRNEFLTVIEDAVAEARYQMRNVEMEEEEVVVDVSELKMLVEQAWLACEKWFELIDVGDVEEAVAAVRMDDGMS